MAEGRGRHDLCGGRRFASSSRSSGHVIACILLSGLFMRAGKSPMAGKGCADQRPDRRDHGAARWASLGCASTVCKRKRTIEPPAGGAAATEATQPPHRRASPAGPPTWMGCGNGLAAAACATLRRCKATVPLHARLGSSCAALRGARPGLPACRARCLPLAPGRPARRGRRRRRRPLRSRRQCPSRGSSHRPWDRRR